MFRLDKFSHPQAYTKTYKKKTLTLRWRLVGCLVANGIAL
jgi:hypothetical protein